MGGAESTEAEGATAPRRTGAGVPDLGIAPGEIPTTAKGWCEVAEAPKRIPKPFTVRDCYLEALKLDRKFSKAWSGLAESLDVPPTSSSSDRNSPVQPEPTIEVDGIAFDRVGCYTQAVENDLSNEDLYVDLAIALFKKSSAASQLYGPDHPDAKEGEVTIDGKQFTARDCLTIAVQLNPACGEAWAVLGTKLGRSSIEIEGMKYNSQSCFLQAVMNGATTALSWNGLGATIDQDSTVLVAGESLTAVRCFQLALEENISFASAWYNLGCCIREGIDRQLAEDKKAELSAEVLTVEVKGMSYSERDCFIKAIENQPNHALAWGNLGAILRPDESIVVSQSLVTQRDCYINALAFNPSDGGAWEGLASEMADGDTVTIRSVTFTKKQCYANAVKTIPRLARAWSALGRLLAADGETIKIKGVAHSARDCYVQACQHNLRSPSAWWNVARIMKKNDPSDTITISNVQFTKIECLLKALELDPDFEPSWHSLGVLLPESKAVVMVHDEQFNKVDCFVQCLERSPQFALAWFNLGCALMGGGAATGAQDNSCVIAGEKITDRVAFVKALQIDTNMSGAWCNLGSTLAQGEEVEVNEVKMTERDCFSKAVALKPTMPQAWLNLSVAMAADEVRTIHGVKYSKKDCLVMTLNHSPKDSPTYTKALDDLCLILYVGDQVVAQGRTYEKKRSWWMTTYIEEVASTAPTSPTALTAGGTQMARTPIPKSPVSSPQLRPALPPAAGSV